MSSVLVVTHLEFGQVGHVLRFLLVIYNSDTTATL